MLHGDQRLCAQLFQHWLDRLSLPLGLTEPDSGFFRPKPNPVRANHQAEPSDLPPNRGLLATVIDLGLPSIRH